MLDASVPMFIEAVRTGSFTKAAERLYTTPTSVMNQVNRLERLVGVKLVNRNFAGITLTPAGESYYADVLTMRDFAEQAQLKALRAAHDGPYLIRVGSSSFHQYARLAQIWGSLAKPASSQPDGHGQNQSESQSTNRPSATPSRSSGVLRNPHDYYQLQIVDFTDTSIIGPPPAGIGIDFDVMMGNFDPAGVPETYRFIPLGQTPLSLYTPNESALASHGPVGLHDLDFAELVGPRLIMPEQSWLPSIAILKQRMNELYPHITVETVSYHSGSDLFNRCLREGTPMVGLEYWDEVVPLLTGVPLNDHFVIPHGLIYRSDAPKEVQLFAEIITRQVIDFLNKHDQVDVAQAIQEGRVLPIREDPAPTRRYYGLRL